MAKMGNMRCLVLLLVVVVVVVKQTQASHFRGAIITWKPGTKPDQVIIDFRISWRMSYGSQFECNDQIITKHTPVSGTGTLTCFGSNCGRRSFGQLSYICTDFSVSEDWSSGKGRINHTFPHHTSLVYRFGFTGSAWIDTLNVGAGGDWSLEAKANLSIRTDNSKINSSPSAEISPIIRLQHGCSHIIKIPVQDPDGDVVRCSVAQGRDQCGNICNGFPNSILNNDTCTINYEAKYRLGWYAVAIQVEDFTDANSTTPLSSIPVQFLVYVYNSNETCGKTTVFVDPTPPEDACIGVPYHEVYASAVIARVANANRSISEMVTLSPVGLSRERPLQKVNGTDWRMNFTFNPSDALANTTVNTFCFTAKETSGMESDKRCIKFLTGVSAPRFINGTQYPTGKIYSNQSQWIVNVDSDFARASRQTFIRLYDSRGFLLEKINASDVGSVVIDTFNRSFQFSTSTKFIEKEEYYFMFDFGVMKGTTNCGAESTAIEDSYFWRIRIRDVTPPSINMTLKPNKTNSTAEFAWEVNEPVTVTCILTYPYGAVKTYECDKNRLVGIDLEEGVYTLMINATDFEENSASVEHKWSVDTTPPAIAFLRTPSNISRENPAYFKWACANPCYTFCSVKDMKQSVDCSRRTLSWNIPVISNVTHTLRLEAVDDVGNMASVIYTWITDFIQPDIKFCEKGKSLTVDCTGDLTPEAVCNVTTADNMDLEPSLRYSDKNSDSCGLQRTWTATDKAGNVNTAVQTITVTSRQPVKIIQRPGPVSVACGALEELTDILKSMFKVKHPCNLDVTITHKDNSSDICDTVIQRNWTLSDNCGQDILVQQLLRIRQTVEPLTPENGQKGVDLKVYLRWHYSSSQVLYELYLWERDATRTKSLEANTYNNYYEVTSLRPGTMYRWQVVFNYANNESYLSPVWVFETRDFADLSVQSIIVPQTAFTDHYCTVEWTVVNIGGIATQSTYWTDAVFLSWDNEIGNAKRVATVSQRNILYQNDSYSSTAKFLLETELFGPAYIFVQTDYRGYITELDRSNNLMQSLSLIDVKLTPPPDLQVKSIRILEGRRVYSGNTVSVMWTVVNAGKGPTKYGSWFDRILWSPVNTSGVRAEVLSTIKHSGNLRSNDSYTHSSHIRIPEFITGNYSLLIQVDAFNEIFEYLSENNTFAIQNPLHVTLTPPPDLEIGYIYTPPKWQTGETVSVTWTVVNKGYNSPKSQMYWQDSAVLETKSGGQPIGTSMHYGGLAKNDKYNKTLMYYVSPEVQTGVYNLTVISDFKNNLFEYFNKANNKLSKEINVTQALPNLKVQNLTIYPRYDLNKTSISVAWTVKNIGRGKTLSQQWTDTLFVQKIGRTFFSTLKHFHIEERNQVPQGESYNRNETIEIPFTIYGNLQFKINVDDVYSSTGDRDISNNVHLLSDIEIKLRAADLVLDTIHSMKSIQSGQDVAVSYTVTNKGNMDVIRTQWRDRIFITESANNEYVLHGLDIRSEINFDLKQNSSYNKTVTFTIPAEMYGIFFIIVRVDSENDLFEGDKKSNNRGVKMFSTESAPAADLLITLITANISNTNNKMLFVKWSVKNIGNSMQKLRTWHDTILLKRRINTDSVLTKMSYRVEHNLEAYASYSQLRRIMIPSSISGTIYVCAKINAFQSFYESGSGENNILCQTQPVFVRKLDVAKLSAKLDKIISESENNLFAPGSRIMAEFTVENVGQLPTELSSWTDSIYMSDFKTKNIAELKNHGTRVQDVIHVGVLGPNESYSTNTSFMLPVSYEANPHFFVLANNAETDTLDESIDVGTTSQPQTEYPAEFGSYLQQVDFAFLLPNLRIVSNAAITTSIQGGQPVNFQYVLVNDGNVSTNHIWYDSAYLSHDIILDAFDTKLTSVLRSVKLNANGNITVNISFILPLNLDTKSYFLTVVADSRDDIFEVHEKDNSFRTVIDVKGKASTDIAVSDVVAQKQMEYGKEVYISWRVINKGIIEAHGFKCDSVYLSEDKIWDINDAQIGQSVCSNFDLRGNSTQFISDAIRSKMPDVASSLYNTIVKSRSNLLDLNLDNNIAISGNKSKATYTTISVNTTTIMKLTSRGSIILQVVNVSNEETLIFNISSDSRDSFNSLYAKGGSPATLYDFDISSDDPNTPDQILTVPNTMYSEYYILIVNTGSLSNSRDQKISLTVKYAHFEILDVYPKTLIAGAKTTFHITGTMIPYDARIQLKNAKVKFEADKTFIFSSTSAFATFYIAEKAPLHLFSMVLMSDALNKTIQFSKYISMKSGINGYLVYSVQTPSRLRNGETGIISINLQNAGDSDIYVPLVVTEASEQGSIRLIDDTSIHVFQQKYFVFGSAENGPAGILPPQAHCQLKFETKQNESYNFGRIEMELNTFVMKQNKDTPNPFIRQKNSLRPSHYDEHAWTPIWNNFVAATGDTSLSLSRKLSDILNEMSLAGRYVKNVDDIIGYLLEVADAPYPERIVTGKSDLQLPSNSEVTLTIDRYLSARIGSRSQASYLGKGWILPLWDTKIKHISEDVVTISVEKLDFHFIKLNNNSFIHKKLGVISKGNTELIYSPYKQRKEFHFDRDTFGLTEISSLVDDSFLEIEYEGNLLTKIRHSSGAFVSVKYDRHDRIQIMQLENSSTSLDNAKMLCVYDLDSGMLSEVRLNGERTRYSYFQDSALKYIIKPDRSMILYEYSKLGHLVAKKLIKNGKEVTSQRYSHSSGGVVSVERKPKNKIYNLTFNENGDVIFIQRKGFLPDKTVITTSTEIQYDGDMIVTKRTRSSDGDSLLIEDGNGDSLHTVFNNKSQLIGFTDGTGNEYKINLNKNGSMQSIVFPDGSNKNYVYTPNGHAVITQNNGTKEFVYNDRKQLIMKNIGNGSTYTYTYDENGKLIIGENDNGRIALSYIKDKVDTVAYPDVSLSYKYNEDGLVSSLSTNNDYFVSYKYSDSNKLELVTDRDGKHILKVEYDAAGKIKKKLLGNNATTTYTYDSVTGMLQNMTNYFPNGSIASYFRYEYSLHLRRISVDTHEGMWKFKYDRSGQVISMTSPNKSVTEYTYDKSKNRIRVSVDGFDYETKVNNMNQYNIYRKRSHSYDKNGNMNFRRDDLLQEFFSFDEDNKIVSYKSEATDCVFGYDALDNLYSKKCNDTTTRYIVNPRGNYGSDIIGQVTSKHGEKTSVHYYHGGDGIGLIAARYDDGSMHYFMYDPIGTVQEILNEKGDLLNSYFSDPFGQTIRSFETFKSLFTFVGQWGVVDFEEIPDMYFMRSRLYDSYTGRFLSIDAYGLKAHSKNLYAYCANNPVNCNDPNGNFLNIIGGAAVGAAFGVLDYALSTPHKSWSWGGAAGAAFSGGVSGAIASTGLGLFGEVLFTTVGDLGGGWISRKIDHQPYTFKDTIDDFEKSLLTQSENKILGKPGKVVRRLFQGLCQTLHFANKTHPEQLCGILMDGLYGLVKSATRWILSRDPNDMIGPTGFGAAKFINKKSRLMYTIRFENDENATAPAQRVYIEHKYSKHLDPRSFNLGQFGFGNFSKKVNSKMLQDKIHLTDEHGTVLRVFAGLDLPKQMIIWEFQSLDPKTGEAPVDPGIGFLPPNNGTSGQGYVSFSIQPKEDVKHLSTIHANASIFFDQNDPIDTPNIFNTIDDISPDVNGTVIKETESSDSVTLSFNAMDSGSGVKYINLFQKQDNGFSIFRPGLTDDIFVMPLQPGESYSLVAVGIDHVGNQMDIAAVLPNSLMNVTSAKQIFDCNCSGYGNCSSGTDYCNCMDGYYGPNCNSTVPPPEPPVLELKAEAGFVGQPIELTISARNLSGSLEEIEMFISGFQNDTVFSAGHLLTNGNLYLSYKEFGKINMTTQEHGLLKLNINVVQTSTVGNISRSGVLFVNVYKTIDNVTIHVQGCLTEYNDLNAVSLNLTVVFENETVKGSNNHSNIVPHTTLLKVPTWMHPVGDDPEGKNGVYTIGDTLFHTLFSIGNLVEPVMLSVAIHSEQSGLPTSTYSREFQIERFCGGECGPHQYGVSCDQNCHCNWQNAERCDKFTGSCICRPEWEGPVCNDSVCHCITNNTAKCEPLSKTCMCEKGWTGKICEIDIDECKNETICDSSKHTICVNSDGGYDCVCRAGYTYKEDRCVECVDGQYGMNCKGICNCTKETTVKCEKSNGTCKCETEWTGATCSDFACPCIVNYTAKCDPNTKTCDCKEGWTGAGCDTDINECVDTTICESKPHTACKNMIPGYDCLCRLGYKMADHSDALCVECVDGQYGINCEGFCNCTKETTFACEKSNGTCICETEWTGATCSDFACPCVVNHTAKCDPNTKKCICKEGWTGAGCDTDINECVDTTICESKPHTACQNKIPGYDCLCRLGYKMADHSDALCVECVDGQFGMNCEGICNCTKETTDKCEKSNGTCKCETEWTGATCSDFACPCVVNNTAKCDPKTKKCICKEGWTGAGCDTDINECDNTTICESKPHTACQNKIPGYDCLCRLGYKKDDSALCVAKKEPDEDTTVKISHDATYIISLLAGVLQPDTFQTLFTITQVTFASGNRHLDKKRMTPVTIHLDIDVPSTVNLQVEDTYQTYKIRAVDMLTDYYKNELRDSFVRVIVQSISLGSLVIEHDVVTKETKQVSEDLAVAVVKMKTPDTENSLLTFYGQKVSVEGVSLNNTEVKNVCEAFMSLNPCNSTGCIEDHDNKPKCRKLTTDNQKDYTVLIISLSTSIPVAILITALIVGFCLRKNREEDSKKINNDNIQFRRKSYVYEHANPGYDDTETEDDDGRYLTLKSSTMNKRYDYLNRTWQDNPYYDQSSSSAKGKYDAEHDAYVYNGRNK